MATLTASLPDDVTGWIEGQIGEGGHVLVVATVHRRNLRNFKL